MNQLKRLKLFRFNENGDFYLYQESQFQYVNYEMGNLLATTDESLQFGDVLKLNESKIKKLLLKNKSTKGNVWDVSVKEKMECNNVECNGNCLECNLMTFSIDTEGKEIKIEKIL
jgi:hypothetical protein